MIIPPIRDRGKGRKANSSTLEVPIGGWNARDAIDTMPARDCVQLINWVPTFGALRTRPGYAEHGDTGTGEPCFTVANFNSGSSEKLIVGAGSGGSGKLQDMTTGTPTDLKTGLQSSYWSTVQFNRRLWLANGVDTVQVYDGSTMADSTFTGVTLANLIFVTAHKARLWFVEKDTQKAWYSAANAITGSLTAFDLSYVVTRGGRLRSIIPMSIDGGSGPDDLLAFLFDGGSVVVYAGTDPASSSTWAIVGEFTIGEPICKRGCSKYGNDAAIVCEDGYQALSRVIPFNRAGSRVNAISDKIVNAAQDAARRYGANTGWQVFHYPQRGWLIINVPQTATRSMQHVYIAETKAWTRFRGINACGWGLYGRDAYFGGWDGKVYQFDVGASDDGAVIQCDVQTGPTYLGNRNVRKLITLCRPIFRSVGTPAVGLSIVSDFEEFRGTIPLSTAVDDPGAIWDQGIWDDAVWAGGIRTSKDWQGVGGGAFGYGQQLRLRCETEDETVDWMSTQLLYQRAGPV